MEKEIKNSHGGARAGAGRKREPGREKAFATRISFAAHARLTEYAKARGMSITAALNSILEALPN